MEQIPEESTAGKIFPVEISKEMKSAYIDYSMSVIVSRALPDVRDGLKPVHRRILYTMYEAGLYPDRPYRKSATTVGDVLGKYHPHGDAAVYETLVRLAQDFSLRYPLVDGQGNFGSIDGDAPAAYRYTEARMAKIAMDMLSDIDKETVDFQPNFDDRHKEPVVLPARFPNLLANGSTGIAVGMATSIPSHNLGELIDAIEAIIDNPALTFDELLQYVKGPDFPTGGIILGYSGIRQAYYTGRSKLRVRAKAEIEEWKDGRFRIVVTELPYMVNKARLVESIAEHVKDKRIEGISDLRDESDKNGMSVVIELKRDANPQVVLNQLYKYTQMEDTFPVNMIALHDGVPRTMTLREMLDYYIEHQREVTVRRTEYELRKLRERAHILEGLKIACDNIDEVIRIIRASRSIPDAKQNLIERFDLSEIQAQAIVQMQLGRLSGLEVEKIMAEYAEIQGKIRELELILSDNGRIMAIVKQELSALRRKYADERRTMIDPVAGELDIEDLIKEETCVFTRTHCGYIKRVPADTFRAQKRGGRGITGMTTREEDYAEDLFVASTHDYILFFTSKGKVYRLKGYEVPEGSRTSKGMNIINLIEVEQDENITAMIRVHEYDDDKFLTMATRRGIVKRTPMRDYNTARKGGLRAIVLDEDDELVDVRMTCGDDTLVIGTHNGMAIHFRETDVRPMGRVTHGVRGIHLGGGDYVVGMARAVAGATLLSVTERGFGKRTALTEYKTQTRGGKGLRNYALSQKTGKVVGIRAVDAADDIMLISSDGIIIRMQLDTIPLIGRSTQGVRLMRLQPDVSIVNFAVTERAAEEPEQADADEGAQAPAAAEEQA